MIPKSGNRFSDKIMRKQKKGSLMNTPVNSAATLKPAKLNTPVAVEIIGMNKWYGNFHVLRDINLKVMGG